MAGFLPRVLSLIVIMVAQPVYSYHVELPEGMTPAQATWLWGHHSIPGYITRSGTPYWYVYPHTDVDKISNPVWSEVAATHIKPGVKVPAVLVLHGCSGLSYGTTEYRRFFIESGYAIFEPDSFARPGHSCNSSPFHDRVEEIGLALREIRKLPWIEPDQIYLMGISQGGSAVAHWNKPGFAGHIIIAANCEGQKDLRPTAPANIPVLAVIGESDSYSNGTGCAVKRQVAGSASVVIKGAGHGISDLPETGKAIAEFLRVVGRQ